MQRLLETEAGQGAAIHRHNRCISGRPEQSAWIEVEYVCRTPQHKKAATWNSFVAEPGLLAPAQGNAELSGPEPAAAWWQDSRWMGLATEGANPATPGNGLAGGNYAQASLSRRCSPAIPGELTGPHLRRVPPSPSGAKAEKGRSFIPPGW